MLILLGIYILVCGGGKLKALPKLLGDHTDLGHLVIIRRLLVGIGRQHGDQQVDIPVAGRRAIDQMNIAGRGMKSNGTKTYAKKKMDKNCIFGVNSFPLEIRQTRV